MKNPAPLICLVITLVIQSLPTAHAEVIEVKYKSFYSHVKKLKNEDTQALQFAFGFQNIHQPRLCKISSARIVTPKKIIDLTITPEYRFTIPSERALNLAEAVVAIDLLDQPNQCDMSVQLETRAAFLKQYYSNTELMFIYQQYSAFFNQMGSFLSFMMPQIDGLMFHFEDKNLDKTLKNQLEVINGVLIVDSKWLALNKPIILPTVPLRITARTDNSTSQ